MKQPVFELESFTVFRELSDAGKTLLKRGLRERGHDLQRQDRQDQPRGVLPGGADGRTIATGMFFANDRQVVVGRQTGLIFVYNTKTGRLISKLDNDLRTGQTFLNDTTFAPDGSAYVTDSVNPVLYRVAPTRTSNNDDLQTLWSRNQRRTLEQ